MITCAMQERSNKVESQNLTLTITSHILLRHTQRLHANVPCHAHRALVCKHTTPCARAGRVPLAVALYEGSAIIVHVCTVYDRICGYFPAKNTVYTPYIFMVLANPTYRQFSFMERENFAGSRNPNPYHLTNRSGFGTKHRTTQPAMLRS
jgi:hypothetical protein